MVTTLPYPKHLVKAEAVMHECSLFFQMNTVAGEHLGVLKGTPTSLNVNFILGSHILFKACWQHHRASRITVERVVNKIWLKYMPDRT